MATARRIHRILRDRLTLLVQEFFIVVRKLYRLRDELDALLRDAYRSYVASYMVRGHVELDALSSLVSRGVEVYAASRSVAGVRAPLLELKSVPEEVPLLAPSETVPVHRSRKRIIELIVSIAELERELFLLGIELERTKRRVNMLEYVLIPRLQRTIRYLRMKFEEREREEKTRLKRVKTVLARRRGA